MSFRARRLELDLQVYWRALNTTSDNQRLSSASPRGLLALGALAGVVVLVVPGEADLDQGGDVQGVVQPAVPAAVEPVPVLVALLTSMETVPV